MHYNKQPLELSQIISMLKERGLLFEDEQNALRELKNISYFRIAGYLRPMEIDKTTHTYKVNSTFENALSIYYFDKELRTILFSVLDDIEIALRAKLIHFVSLKYGPFWYSNSDNYINNNVYEDIISHITKELERTKEEFIIEHYNKYFTSEYPPTWKTLEILSFGTLSKLFCNLKDNKIKKEIAKDFLLPQHLYLESWVKSFTVLRNCIAHHSRIWNRRFPWKPQLPYQLQNPWIDNRNIYVGKLYAQLCCLLYLENVINENNTIKDQLISLFNKYPNIDLKAIGFPDKWYDEPIWKI